MINTSPGRSFPIGATVAAGVVNFCVYSRHATAIDLLLFAAADDAAPTHIIHLDPELNRTYYYWHVFVEGVGAGQLYGYRVDGPHEPDRGLRFDPEKLLIDPYALALSNMANYQRAKAQLLGDNTATALKSVVVDPAAYDWEGDTPLRRSFVDVEGPTDDPEIEALCERQIKNFITVLLMSQGRPMLLICDEVRRTQQGNNNAYVQDNAISWLDWNEIDRQGGLRRFVRGLIQFHQQSPLFRDRLFWSEPGGTDVIWHGVQLLQPDLGYNSHTLAFELTHPDSQQHLHVLLNAYWGPLAFAVPDLPPDQHWQRLVDTTLTSPNDFCDPAVPFLDNQYLAQARSVVVLTASAAA